MEKEFKYEVDEKLDTCKVIGDVIRYYKENGILVREFLMISQVQTLLLKYQPYYEQTLMCNIHKAIDKSRS